jgi:hypothetical protein
MSNSISTLKNLLIKLPNNMAVIHLHKINSLDNFDHPSDFADGFLSVYIRMLRV